jgi:hypothetical protein
MARPPSRRPVNRKSLCFFPVARICASSASRVCSVISNLTDRPVFFWRTVPRSRVCPYGAIYPDANEIAASELAVDRNIKHGEIARAPLGLKLRADRPAVPGSERRFRAGQLALVPGYAARSSRKLLWILHGLAPSLLRRTSIHRAPQGCV